MVDTEQPAWAERGKGIRHARAKGRAARKRAVQIRGPGGPGSFGTTFLRGRPLYYD